MSSWTLSAPAAAAVRAGVFFASIMGVVAATSSGFSQSPPADPVIAIVNGIEIKGSDLAVAENKIGRKNLPPNDEKKKRELLLDYLIDVNLVARAAENEGKTEDPSLERRMAYVRNRFLMEQTLVNASNSVITERALQDAYAKASEELAKQTEYRVWDMSFSFPDPKDPKGVAGAEEKAGRAIERISKGEDFATVAKEMSDSVLVSQTGGDLGYLENERLIFLGLYDPVSKLELGRVSDPVRTVLAWHVLKVEDKRPRQVPAFEKIRKQLETYLVRKVQLELITKLRSEARIERLDASKNASPPK